MEMATVWNRFFCKRRFIEFVEWVRREESKLVDQDMNLFEIIWVSRSLRQTYNTKARQVGMSDHIIDRWNRWRKVERSRSRKPHLEMRERYKGFHLMVDRCSVIPLQCSTFVFNQSQVICFVDIAGIVWWKGISWVYRLIFLRTDVSHIYVCILGLVIL